MVTKRFERWDIDKVMTSLLHDKPDGAIDFELWASRPYVSSIGCSVFGKCSFSKPLTFDRMNELGLWTIPVAC